MTAPFSASLDSLMAIAAQHLDVGQLREAEAVYVQVLDQQQAHDEALLRLAQTQEKQGRAADAIESYRRLLLVAPNRADVHAALGALLLMQGPAEGAIASLNKALALGEDSFNVRRDLGDALMELERHAEALIHYAEILTRNPDSAGANMRIGAAYRALHRNEDAAFHLRRALEINPGLTMAQWDLAYVLLLLGDLAAGFPLLEKRFDADVDYFPQIRQFASKPKWDGSDLQGKTILVWAEQGMGDNIMMMRYLPLLKNRGAGAIIVYCHAVLIKIALTATSLVVNSEEQMALGSFDCHCSMYSLPFLFGTTLDSIPQNIPYLKLPAAVANRWKKPLERFTGIKVGIAWAGSKNTAGDKFRSIALERFAPLMSVGGVQFVSLQKDDDAEQLQQSDWPILNWMGASTDLIDTAALIEQLDLVISVDTVIVHMAGALGKPVWLLNRYGSEWRWLLGREDTPWYPSMRIFNQAAKHDWTSVMQTIAGELGQLVADKRDTAMTSAQWQLAAKGANKLLGIDVADGSSDHSSNGIAARLRALFRR